MPEKHRKSAGKDPLPCGTVTRLSAVEDVALPVKRQKLVDKAHRKRAACQKSVQGTEKIPEEQEKEEQKNGKENRPAGIQRNTAPPADSHAHRKGGAQSNAEYGATSPIQKDLRRIDRLDRRKNQHKRTAAGRILFPEKEKVQQGAEDGKQKGVRNAHGNGTVDRFHRKNAGQKENAGCGKDHAEAEKIRPVKGKHDRKQKREQGKEQKAPYIHAGYHAAQDSGQIQDKKKSGKRRRIKPAGAQAQDSAASGKGQ